MVILKLGLTHVTQLKTPLPKRIQAVLELTVKALEVLSQVLVLIAWALLRDTLTLMFNMMVINKTGLINVMLHKIHGLRKTQVELELGMVQRLMVLSQESELDVKVSLNSKKMMWLFHLEAMLLGQRSVMQLRTLLHKRIQVELELTKKKIRVLSLVLASTAKASLKWASPLTDLDQKLLSTKIARITFQTATVLTVSKVLTAAELMRT
jgi:hypothetical protein